MSGTMGVMAAAGSVAIHLLLLALVDPHVSPPVVDDPSQPPVAFVRMPNAPEPDPEPALAPEPEPNAGTSIEAPQRQRTRAPAARQASTTETSPAADPAPMPAWMRRNIGDPRWVVSDEPSLLGEELAGPLTLERHADGSVTFRGKGVEGCRYPDGTIHTRRAGHDGDPCCHPDAIDECGCQQDDADPRARAAVLEQLRSEL